MIVYHFPTHTGYTMLKAAFNLIDLHIPGLSDIEKWRLLKDLGWDTKYSQARLENVLQIIVSQGSFSGPHITLTLGKEGNENEQFTS